MDATARGAVIGIIGNGEVEVTGLAGHPVLGAELVTGCSDPSSCDLQGTDQDTSDLIASAHSSFDEFADEVNIPTLPVCIQATAHAITTLTSLMEMTALISQVRDMSRSTMIFNLTYKRNKRQEILVRSLHYQRLFQQENASANNPYWISKNPRFSPFVHTVKAMNVCWHRGRLLRMKPSEKQQKEKLTKRLGKRRRNNEQSK